MLFSSGSDSKTVKATVFDVTFGSSEIRKQDVNVDTTLPFDADKSAPLQWNVTKKKDLSDYLTAVSQLASSGLKWIIDDEAAVTSSILNYRGKNSGRMPILGNIITFNVEVSHQQYSHLSDKFILVIYPGTTATKYDAWVSDNRNFDWTGLPKVYSALEANNMDPEPAALECAKWLPPEGLDSYYHPGAAREMRTEALESENTQGHQATYNIIGTLITMGLGAGTADRVAPFRIDEENDTHLDKDVEPFIWAAQLDGNPVKGNLAFSSNLTHPLMHKGEKLIQYLDLRPIRVSEPLDRGMCPPEETEETTE